jgi:hypothetical protein
MAVQAMAITVTSLCWTAFGLGPPVSRPRGLLGTRAPRTTQGVCSLVPCVSVSVSSRAVVDCFLRAARGVKTSRSSWPVQ